MTLTQTAFDWIERLFGHEETYELAEPVIEVGDVFYSGDLEIEVVDIQETSPYYVIPADWLAWGDADGWAYVYCAQIGAADWVPVSYLKMLALEA
jgi:hypothetical protein